MNPKKTREPLKLSSEERRRRIVSLLSDIDKPLSAMTLASSLGVSRQIIVGDVALLRASGVTIFATPRGYVYSNESSTSSFGYEGIIACKHSASQLQEELYTMVDLGGTVIDVTIEHSLYGQISGLLDLHSRHDVDLFLEKIQSEKGDLPLSNLTGGIHLHRIGCRNEEAFQLIQSALKEKGITLS